MTPTAIFGPFFAMLGLTLGVWIYLYARRIPFIRSLGNVDLSVPGEFARLAPASVSNPSDNFKNLFELPVLLYALSLYLFVTQVDSAYVAAGWIFVVFRVLHSAVHCTFNLVILRFYLYLVSCLALGYMGTVRRSGTSVRSGRGAGVVARARLWPRAGRQLRGTPSEFPSSWHPPGGDRAFCEIESRPADPHSIQLECFLHDGQLFAQSHRWAMAQWWPVQSWASIWLAASRRARAHRRALYELRAVPVTDPALREPILRKRGYDPVPDGIVLFRFEPRSGQVGRASGKEAGDRAVQGAGDASAPLLASCRSRRRSSRMRTSSCRCAGVSSARISSSVRQAVLVERGLRGADAVGEMHHGVAIRHVLAEPLAHLEAERVELLGQALVLGPRGVRGGADAREHLGVEPEALGVAFEQGIEGRPPVLAPVTGSPA